MTDRILGCVKGGDPLTADTISALLRVDVGDVLDGLEQLVLAGKVRVYRPVTRRGPLESLRFC